MHLNFSIDKKTMIILIIFQLVNFHNLWQSNPWIRWIRIRISIQTNTVGKHVFTGKILGQDLLGVNYSCGFATLIEKGLSQLYGYQLKL
jgi:hypothetical protein